MWLAANHGFRQPTARMACQSNPNAVPSAVGFTPTVGPSNAAPNRAAVSSRTRRSFGLNSYGTPTTSSSLGLAVPAGLEPASTDRQSVILASRRWSHVFWGDGRDLNPQPSVPQTDALNQLSYHQRVVRKRGVFEAATPAVPLRINSSHRSTLKSTTEHGPVKPDLNPKKNHILRSTLSNRSYIPPPTGSTAT